MSQLIHLLMGSVRRASIGLWCFSALALSFEALAGPSTTTLIGSPANVIAGQNVTLTAQVSGLTPTGTVTFKQLDTVLATVTLTNGSAVRVQPLAVAGPYWFTATYSGDSQNLASTSGLLTVQVAPLVSLPAAPVSPTVSVALEYDAVGNPTKRIVAPAAPGFNIATVNAYDSLSRLRQTTDAKAGVTTVTYNGQDLPTQVTDPRLLVTQTPRNGLGDPTQLVSPDTGTATMAYDAAGNLQSRVDSRGVTSTYYYDALNRPTVLALSAAGQTTQYTQWYYDQTGGTYGQGAGRLTSTSHPEGATWLGYTDQGRLNRMVQRVTARAGANSINIDKSVSYGYDLAGNRTSITYPSGRVLNIAYAGGVPSGLSFPATTLTPEVKVISQIQYSPDGQTQGWAWQMASSTASHVRTFDSSGRMVRYPLGAFVRDIAYDTAGRVASYSHLDGTTGTATAAAQALNQTFTYDELDRVKTVVMGTSSWSINYDANGNRTSVSLNGVGNNYGVAANSNRLNSTSAPARSFNYDAAGNSLADGQFSATYNMAGRLATLTKAGVTSYFTYDTEGRRTRKFNTNGGITAMIFMYDDAGHLLGEYDAYGATLREYIWLGDIPIAMFSGATTAPPTLSFIHADHLDTPRVVVNTGNQLRWRWMAEPFGTTAADNNPAGLGAFTFNLRFPGQYADSETGLYYNGFRDYDPSIGRYTQSDPIGLDGGINTYAYVEGNPVSLVDPTGEFGVPGAVIGGGVELGLQLLLNGGNLKCIDWWAVGVAGASGAVGGAALGGVFKLSKGSMKWENVRRRYRRGHDVPGSQDVHHWALERNGAVSRQLDRLVGRETRDAIVNHPANLHAIDRAVHQGVHNSLGPLGRWWYGTPGWAKALQGSAGVGAAGEAMQGCECSR